MTRAGKAGGAEARAGGDGPAGTAGRPLPDREVLESLVAIPSVTGSEAEAVRFLQGLARRDGLRVSTDSAGNFVAEAGTGPRFLLFCGHVDTVPGEIPVRTEGGELWGRGSVDAKGPLAAAYCAARRHLRSHDLTIRIVGVVDEEGDSRGARALDRTSAPDWILVGEPSGVDAVTVAYKGILRASFTLRRERHHGAHPGPTAVEEAIAWWTNLARAHRFEDRFDALQGHLLSLETSSDGLDDTVTGRLQVRLPPRTDPRELARSLQADAAAAGVALEVGETMPPAEGDKRSPLVAALLGSIRATGGKPRLLRKTGTADFNHLAQWFPGVPLAAYGPGDASLDHTPQERIALRDFDRAVDVLDEVFGTLAALPHSRPNKGGHGTHGKRPALSGNPGGRQGNPQRQFFPAFLPSLMERSVGSVRSLVPRKAGLA